MSGLEPPGAPSPIQPHLQLACLNETARFAAT